MIGLKLREEFLVEHMPGTAISLRTSDNQGAAQKSPDYILSITYPTADVQTALKAISTKRNRCPIVLMGDRGRGKSHIMAVMHHAIQSPSIVENWIKEWTGILGRDEISEIEIVTGYIPISEPVHNNEYPFLWDLLFDRHPKGEYYRGQFEVMAQSIPPRSLLEKMFEDNPTCLILDEFQTWYDGLPEKDPKNGLRTKNSAFNFIQNLSEIAKERPELLIFVISVLDNQNQAFQQVHRQSPIIIDFRGPSAKQDRQKLLLHRLFENRRNIPLNEITSVSDAYASERVRLLFLNKSKAEIEHAQQEVIACWPFSPELLDLLEDHILLSSVAQETRDMIRILAQVFRSRGEAVPIITPCVFYVDGKSEEVQTLIDAISVQSGQEKIRQIAQRNLEAVRDAAVNTPNARELISTIWMRSMSPAKAKGVSPAELHLDITRGVAIDDNAFQAELAILIENSINIHGDEIQNGHLWFGIDENPRSKVRACAKNNKLWHPNAVATAGQIVYPGKDFMHIRNTLKHIFITETSQSPSRVIILGTNWMDDPWSDVDDFDKPAKWDRPILIVIPDQIENDKNGINMTLGKWLADNVPKRRNTVRFLLLSKEYQGLYNDVELIFSARCSFLCSREGWGSDAQYKTLLQDFDRPLRQALKTRFNRVAIIRKWDYQSPQNCVFDIEKITAQGENIPSAVESKILSDLFDMADFKEYIINRAKDSDFISSVMDDLTEPPPPNSRDAIPFLGETKTFEFILEIASQGDIALNVNGSWIGRRQEDNTDEDALRYMRSKAFRTGQEMRQIMLGLLGKVNDSGGIVPVPQTKNQPVTQTGTQTGETPIAPVNGESGIQTPTSPSAPVGDDTEDTDGTETTTSVAEPVFHTNKTPEATIGINLAGYFETWGLTTETIDSAKIEFSGLTPSQIKQILQRIPSAFKANLEITYKEGEDK